MIKLWPMYLSLLLLAAIAFFEYEETELAKQQAELQRQASQPFMTVDSLTYLDGMITTNRQINLDESMFPEGVVADWMVTVVREDRRPPSCQTQPGTEINQGWSIYDQFEPTTQTMSLDLWVWHEGCYEKLSDGGVYHMYVVWIPRNPLLMPARASLTFVVDKGGA